MWKMYNRKVPSGSTSAFWDQVWDSGDSLVGGHENDRICDNQGPLSRLMKRHVRPDRLFLEGGCGPANWARHFHQRGYRTVGVDFAERTVQKVRALAPGFDVRVGDVTALPFDDGSVHSYYSGGVVEHFESGPEPALREARRVMASDGRFLCSVPDSNLIRRQILFRLSSAREVFETRVEPPPEDLSFFQYTFTEEEFTARLEQAGFVVDETFGYALLWGLMEFPGVEWLVHASKRMLGRRGVLPPNGVPDACADPAGSGKGVDDGGVRQGPVRRALERVLLLEDTSIPVIGSIIGTMREYCSNMRMYVARPR
jgi:SAM-dependent methyltransferase